MSKELFEEIRDRIHRDIAHYDGQLPERSAISWSGYIAALLEWNLISVVEYEGLLHVLPDIDDDPVVAIFLGRPD